MSKVTDRVFKVFLLLRSEISNPKEVKIFPKRESGLLRTHAHMCACVRVWYVHLFSKILSPKYHETVRFQPALFLSL